MACSAGRLIWLPRGATRLVSTANAARVGAASQVTEYRLSSGSQSREADQGYGHRDSGDLVIAQPSTPQPEIVNGASGYGSKTEL